MAEPASEVLGHLLLLQGTLHVMSEPRSLGEFLCAGLTRVPGIGGCALFVDGVLVHSAPSAWPPPDEIGGARNSEEAKSLALRTPFATYGSLMLRVTDASALEVYLPFLENVANLVALLLETRAQKRDLLQAHELLERRVEQRTAELKASVESLADREHFIQRVCNTAPTLIYIYDLAEHRNVYCNDASETVLGLTVEETTEIGGALFARLIHPDDLPAIAAHQQRLASAKDSDVLEVTYRVRRASGEWRTLHSYEVVFARDERNVPTRTAGVAIDISTRISAERERRELEEQLLHAHKVESIGRLAGGVAHDLNNLLTPILGLTQFVLEDLPADSASREDLKGIQNAADRCQQLTQQLLAFGRKQFLEMKSVDLDALVEEYGTLLRRLLREHIVLDIRSSGSGVCVLADAGQLGQVLVNLAVNAQDAMPDGGTLRITVGRRVVAPRSPIAIPEEPVGPCAVLEVQDTGCGMEPELLTRAFEPFFTTKGPGRGTGLGLATAHGIVAQHGGNLSVRSAVGKGSTFTVVLPEAATSAQLASDVAAAPALPLLGTTVLVAEDDDAVRSTIERMLRRMNAAVLSARSGEEALSVAAAYAGDIDVLLTDLVMPGMSGAQLYEELIARRPGVRVLFVSGYPDDTLVQQRLDPAAVNLLAKPFTPQVLARRVRELIRTQPR